MIERLIDSPTPAPLCFVVLVGRPTFAIAETERGRLVMEFVVPAFPYVLRPAGQPIVQSREIGALGILKRNTVPWGAFSSAHKRPPWESMMDRQIDSPIPTPLGFVV
jgi:hypothetical protein